jgi:hypothetical protein
LNEFKTADHTSASLDRLDRTILDIATTVKHEEKRKQQSSMDESMEKLRDVDATSTKTDWNAQVKHILAQNNTKKK